MVSAMTWLQKLEFMFRIYDFDESGELTADEMTLALKSTAIGLAKVTNEEPPTEADVEVLSQDVRGTRLLVPPLVEPPVLSGRHSSRPGASRSHRQRLLP